VSLIFFVFNNFVKYPFSYDIAYGEASLTKA